MWFVCVCVCDVCVCVYVDLCVCYVRDVVYVMCVVSLCVVSL